MARSALPVDPARLRREFPDLTEDEVAAFEEVTHRILGQGRPDARAKLTRELLALGRKGREKTAAAALSEEESLAARYLAAVEKMNRTPGRS
jgi:hypothetical protein